MNIFKKGSELYELQEAYNKLDQREALTMTQFDLEDATGIDAFRWLSFLSDGAVQKYIEKNAQAVRQAQMRKLVDLATTNDKSVGTAQMLNAMGKLTEDTETESSFFIYSYVPLDANEVHADNVTQDLRWSAPNDIEDDDVEDVQLAPPPEEPEEVQTDEPADTKKELTDEDWTF